MKRNIFTVLIVLIFGLVSCEKKLIDTNDLNINTNDLNLEISFDDSSFEFENTIYPSFILGLSNYFAKEDKSFGLIKYKLRTPKNDCSLKIKLLQSTVNNESIFQEHLNLKGIEKNFSPKINWNYETLKFINQQGTVDLSFIAYIDDKEIDNKSLRLNYRSVNECVYGIIDKNGEYKDLKFMFGAYVNEDHPKIDGFLKEALNTGIVNSFSGYQGLSKYSVLKQVHAIWYTLQTKGVKYSSITDTSNPSDKVFSQHVRFFDEVYNNTQANCVDGSVFICSILEKIGIKTFLVLVPGHMYIGFYTKSNKSKAKLLETTMIGSINLDDYAPKYKKEVSWEHFVEAVDYNIPRWNNDFSKINDPKNYRYQTFDIEDLRKVTQPIGR